MKSLVVAAVVGVFAQVAGCSHETESTAETTSGFSLGDNTADLEDRYEIVEQGALSPSSFRVASDEMKARIVSATRSSDLDSAIAAVEHSTDGVAYVATFESAAAPSARYTLLTYYPGGAEHGAIFVADQGAAVATIDDGALCVR